MSKLPRVTAKVFASNAAETDIGQYGSALTGAKINTGDIAQIQALPAYETGWRGAVISERNYPTLQEMNGLQKVFSQQIAYLFQNGAFAEWDENTEYCANTSFCQINGVLYQSLTNNNIGNNPSNDETNWKKIDLGGGGGGDTGGGFSLFDVVEKDHILSFEESMGFGLLGTYVYKEPVAGSRYGYPDFYNECVAQKSTEGNTLLALKNNVEVVGSPVVNNGVLSGFSSTTWANLPKAFNPSNKNWEMFYKFKTGTIGTIQYILNTISAGYQPFDIRIGEDGKLQVASFINNTSTPLFSIIGTTALTPATDYYVKLAYNSVTGYELSLGTSKDNLLIEGTNNTTTAINSGSIPTLGADFNNDGNYFQGAFTGSIDLKECYIKIDNELWWSGATTATKNPNGHIFYDIADKATVDEIFAQRGEAWFYGVDTENERVFLPRGTRSQYIVNTDETGDYVEAGLPNITGTMVGDISEGVATGALKIDTIYSSPMWQGSVNLARMRNWSLDASLSNPVYGKSDTVQPYATKKLLYIVVGNVKVQSAASDVVDVTTTENDTVPLFYNFYAKDEDMADAVSFVKSTGTFFGGNLYPTAYEKLVARVGTGNVKAHTDDYTDYDFVVNQDEMTFRLPLKNGKETMFSTACKGNGITLGLTNGATNYGVGVTTGTTTALDGYTGLYGTNIGATNTGTINTQNLSMGVTLDPTKSGIVPHIEIPEGYGLYYKLLNAVVNQELVDFAHIQTELNTKLSRSNKEEIVSWGMPDYTAQSTFTLPEIGQTFTVPYDCLLSIYLIAHSAGNLQLRLNNASGAIIVEAASATNQVETQTNVYLKKGWKIYTSSLISYNKCLITPLINAIGAQ